MTRNKDRDKFIATLLKKHGSQEKLDEWYKKIGRLGGTTKTKKPKGFAANKELAKAAAKKRWNNKGDL